MQDILVTIHTWWRWVVLILAVAAIVFAVMAASGARPWDALSARLALFFPVALSIQALIGILIWLVEQRWADGAFLGYIHPVAMIAAVGIAHAGRNRADRVEGGREKGRAATLFFVLSLVVVLLAIPIYAWPI